MCRAHAPLVPHSPNRPVNRSLRIYIYAISSLFWLGLLVALLTGALAVFAFVLFARARHAFIYFQF